MEWFFPDAIHLVFGDFLYQGNYSVSSDLDWLKRLKIQAIVNATTGIPNSFPDEIDYFRVDVEDDPDDAILLHGQLVAATDFIGIFSDFFIQ